jgi:hypothetical protein
MMKKRTLICLLLEAKAEAKDFLRVLVAVAAGLLKFRKKRKRSLMWRKSLQLPICTWGLQSSGSP